MATTQKDIARSVGVSQTVVSDVLQGRAHSRVSAVTRERILETARQLSYHPNASACSLRTRRARQIAYVATQEDAERHNALGELSIGGLARCLAEHRYRLLIEVAADQAAVPAQIEELVAAGICDGAVVRVIDETEAIRRRLQAVGAPLVVIGQSADPQTPSVAHDVPGMLTEATRALAERGHRRVGLLTGPGATLMHRRIADSWGESATACGWDPRRWYAACATRTESAERAAAWLAEREGPTAIISMHRHGGLGVTRAAFRAGRTIGADFDLVTNAPAAEAWVYEPGTLFFGNDLAEIGRRAALELFRLMQGGSPSGPIRVLPTLRQL